MRRCLLASLLSVCVGAFGWETVHGPPLQPSVVRRDLLESVHRYAVLYTVRGNYRVNPATIQREPGQRVADVTRVDLATGGYQTIVIDVPAGESFLLAEAVWDPFDDRSYLLMSRRGQPGSSWHRVTLDTDATMLNMGDIVDFGPAGAQWPTLRYRFSPDHVFDAKGVFAPRAGGGNYHEDVQIRDRRTGVIVRSWTFWEGIGPEGRGTRYATWVGGDWLMFEKSQKPIQGLPMVEWQDGQHLVVYDFVGGRLVDFGDEVPIGYGKDTVVTAGMDNVGLTVWTADGEVLFRDSGFDLVGPSKAALGEGARRWGAANVRFDGRYVVYNPTYLAYGLIWEDACVVLDLLEDDTFFVRDEESLLLGLF